MFEDLLLHPHTRRALLQFAENPSHSLLLAGGEGLGKTYIARHIITQQLGSGVERLDNYQYFRFIAPEKGSISIETVRGLLGFFKLKTGKGTGLHRFVIVDNADTMTKEAQNSLLKQLEEPPADSLIILTSAHPERLLATIRSRTQIVSVITPESDDVQAYFTGLGFEAANVQRAWLLSDGSLAAAEAILRDTATPDDVIATVKQVLASESFERLLVVDSLSKNREATQEFVTALLRIAEASAKQAASRNSGTLSRWHQVLKHASMAEKALSQNANPKLVLTELMLAL